MPRSTTDVDFLARSIDGIAEAMRWAGEWDVLDRWQEVRRTR